MKAAVTIARILTGGLFIFSGLVKAIDPRGLAYKMGEFFEAWAHDGILPGLMNSLHDYALSFSIIMITLEVVVGVALLIGWQKKLTTWILLLLILFFTFLTSYVLFSGKIRACGCFGDCIPLTPIQTFSKDIILLLLSIFLLVQRKYILPLAKPFLSFLFILLISAATLFLQWYVLRHLPLTDCLPYKKGNDILKLREMPADAVPDKYEYVFVYEKGGEKKEFNVSALPDSTWTFTERKQKLVQKGKNNVPLINDFSFTTAAGNDTTAAILGQQGEYFLLFIGYMNDYPANWDGDIRLTKELMTKGKKLYIITSQSKEVEKRFSNQLGSEAVPLIFTCDGTAIKTAARANPAMFRMNGPVVQQKWSWADFEKVN
jgi:uncharacterized membrane protein YphA (DoxX/SURF4 family)